MRNATLVYSSRQHTRNHINSYSDDITCNVGKLMDSVFRRRSSRLTITGNKYFYAPSEEYKQYVIRFRKIK